MPGIVGSNLTPSTQTQVSQATAWGGIPVGGGGIPTASYDGGTISSTGAEIQSGVRGSAIWRVRKPGESSSFNNPGSRTWQDFTRQRMLPTLDVVNRIVRGRFGGLNQPVYNMGPGATQNPEWTAMQLATQARHASAFVSRLSAKQANDLSTSQAGLSYRPRLSGTIFASEDPQDIANQILEAARFQLQASQIGAEDVAASPTVAQPAVQQYLPVTTQAGSSPMMWIAIVGVAVVAVYFLMNRKKPAE